MIFTYDGLHRDGLHKHRRKWMGDEYSAIKFQMGVKLK
jgi:hypothetical protein